ncbi:MAG TPA: hypothetical protein VFY91_06105 [Microbacterium sp.]|nr:hypothetical protein [Microbacterium sp.]
MRDRDVPAQRPREALEPDAAPQRPTGAAGAADRVLDLQRGAGNAAVARFLYPVVVGMEEQVPIPGLFVCKMGEREPILDTEHHWIEIGEESYGWWPSRDPNEGDTTDRILLWTGVPGSLNGTTLGIGGTATRDPRHGVPARRIPVVGSASTYGGMEPAAAGRAAADTLRRFALGFRANYSWNPAGTDCQEFVQEALSDAGLRERMVIDPLARPADTIA